jgi:hypothetical protein
MRRMERPGRSALEAFQTCISGVNEEELKSRLERIQLTVARESDLYLAAAVERQFHTVPTAAQIDGLVTAEEMSELYSTHFAEQGAAARAIYDELIGAVRNGKCPLCGQGVVYTLDHFLPKYRYPALSVTPLNLVPACRDCNGHKGRRFPRVPEAATLHPYFDNVEEDSWLGARVLEVKPAVVRFFVKKVPHWDEVIQTRVELHFRVLKLSKLYSSNAADELESIRENLQPLFRSGAATLRDYLEEVARGRVKGRLNSWQTAMYVALAASEWYWGGGFALTAD